jgi:hypothetical protein
VLVDGPRHRLIDWGDAVITHPFSTLFVPYELPVRTLAPSEQRHAVLRLRDAYLAGWGTTADRRVFALAVWIAHLTRAVNVAHETLGETEDQREITALLRAWHAKATQLDDVDGVLLPS